MNITAWSPAGTDNAQTPDEMLVSFDRGRQARLLVLPALFDESNKLRRFTLSVMRTLDEAGIDTALPDLPGMNESLASLADQSLEQWGEHTKALAEGFGATHTLTFRGGALLAPASLPGWRYAPVKGPKLLTTLLRARVLEAREAGREEARDALLEKGRSEGLVLGGWPMSAVMVRELQSASPLQRDHHESIEPSDFGARGLWLRAEPSNDADQAKALADRIAMSFGKASDVTS